ncbi:MAG: D-2-hydroxyacid dehydrogenase [Spirochaetaceae bacterium]|nr:MAG: D-2-hydroxyacid dehydrogenase [Spirochaetaceae bacterium]
MTKKTIVLRGSQLHPVTDERNSAIAELAPEYSILIEPDDDVLADAAESIEIVFGSLPGPVQDRATALKWVQLQGAGADRYISFARERGITVTNASGVHAEPISEHLLAMLLAFARELPLAFRHQSSHSWKYDRHPEVFELSGKRALVVGTGAIGDAFARKAAALGVEIVGVRRNAPGDGRAAAPYTKMVGPAALHDELPDADFLVITLPLTDETRGMFGAAEFAHMKKTAYVFNIGRGPIIDQDAMIDALRSGRIAGAGLDVFDPEPLPEDSPLWEMENVIVTTHYAGLTPRYAERLWQIFLENLGRYVAGESLENVVDVTLGY